MSKRIVIILLTVLILLSFPLNAFAKTIVEDDFNEESSSYSTSQFDDVNPAIFTWSETEGKDGTGCIVIENITENDSRYVFKIDAKKNTYYRISAYIKTENVGSGADKKGANISNWDTQEIFGNYTGDTEWTYTEFYGKTGKKQDSFTIALRLGGYSGDNTGKAYFDDFVVEKLDALPKGEEVISLFTSESLPAQYTDSMRGAVLIVIFSSLLFFLYYRYARQNRPDKKEGFTKGQAIIILIFAGFILRCVLALTAPQCGIDVNLFKYWSECAYRYGFKMYKSTSNLDYPPGYMYILRIIGGIASFFKIQGTSAFDLLIKMPAILSDCAIAYIIYKMIDKRLSTAWTLFITALWVFNPVVLVDSAAWGQVDSVLTLTMLGSIYYLTKEKYGVSGCLLAIGVLIKPQALFISPILFYALVKNVTVKSGKQRLKSLLPFVYTLASFVITFIIIALPFILSMGLNADNRYWIIKLYTGTTGHYNYASVNALNYFFLIGKNWASDNLPYSESGVLSLFQVGMIAIVVSSIITWVLYQKNKRFSAVPYLMSSVLIYLAVNFGPRMHERYFFPIIALILAAVIKTNNKWLLYLYSIISAVNFLIVTEILTDLNIGGSGIEELKKFNWPEITTFRWTLAFINVMCSVLLLLFAILYAGGLFKSKEHKIWSIPGEKEEMIERNESRLKKIYNRIKKITNKKTADSKVEEWGVEDEHK